MSKVVVPKFLNKFFENVISKKAHLDSCGEVLDTLVLGNSQGDNSFDTRIYPKAFNLCTRSQDLKYSYLLYEKMGAELQNLKHIILYYSFISPGFVLELNRGEQGMAIALNEIFSLSVDFEDDYLGNLADDLQGLDMGAVKIFEGVNGFFPQAYRTYFNEPYWEDRRAAELLEFNKKEDAVFYLDKLIVLAKQRDHELFFVIPPNREDFTLSAGSDTAFLHRHLFTMMVQHGLDTSTRLLDLYLAQDLVGDEFADYNHVKPESDAAKEMTRRVMQMVSVVARL